MKGHQHLIAMRRAGFVPDWVYLDIDEDAMREWADWPQCHNDRASILVEPSDKRFDLRCVVGLPCFVQGAVRLRVEAVRDACIAAGAKRVIAAVTVSLGAGEFVSFTSSLLTDTEGRFEFDATEVIDG